MQLPGRDNNPTEDVDSSALASSKVEVLRSRHTDDGPVYVCLTAPDADFLVTLPKDQLAAESLRLFQRKRRDHGFRARVNRLIDALPTLDL